MGKIGPSDMRAVSVDETQRDQEDAHFGGPFGYFEHGADIGIVGRSISIEQAFVAAAQAMFALMTDVGALTLHDGVQFEFEEGDEELALVVWLNLLLAHAHEKGLALGAFELKRDGARWIARAWGERWREGLERGTGVKGATLTMLSVKRRDSIWEARCVVDV